MKRGTFSRRELLKGLGAAGIFLPFFPSLNLAAEPKVFPKRLILFFSANGTIPDQWIPTGDENNFQFKRILKPLDAYKQKIMVLRGLGLKSKGPGDGHQQGMGQLFTGSELLPGDTKGGCDTCAPVSWAGNASIDQHVADYFLKQAQAEGRKIGLRSLELGVQVRNSNVWTRMCYRGPGLPVPPKNDPYQVFNELFGGVKDKLKLEALRIQRKSVLDNVIADLDALKNEMNGKDRVRLEEHLFNVRDIERRLDGSDLTASCEPPVQGKAINVMDEKNFPTIGKLQMDMLAMAICCNVTQVASLQWSASVSNVVFSWLGIGTGHHSFSHEGDSNANAVESLIKINEWYAKQYAYLIDKLEKCQEGTGTVLDNSFVLWGNELGKGNSHTRNNIPFVGAGSAGGYFKTGRYLNFGDKAHNYLLTSICHAMGDASQNTFGEQDYKGALGKMTG
ncbi:MAG: DUF1552 domain-containing protein [Myxococcales bacterium]|nr:DUF1552 domain-containing protein [Myxococcales bacterium]